MSRSIRVSDATWKALRVRAAEDGVRVQALADELLMTGLGVAPVSVVVPSNGGDPARVPVSSVPDDRCPKCQCLPVQHRRGAGQNRCERHPSCVWTGVEEAR